MSSEAGSTSGDELTLIAGWTDAHTIELLESTLPEMVHLKPLWERLLVHTAGDRVALGLPVPARLSEDNYENHARHVHSLLNVLGLPLVATPVGLSRLTVRRDAARPLRFDEAAARRLR